MLQHSKGKIRENSKSVVKKEKKREMPGPEMESLSLGAQLASLLLQIEICNLSQEILYGSRQGVHEVPGIGPVQLLHLRLWPWLRFAFQFQRIIG